MSLPWIYLFTAGLLEICWAIGLKYTHGFTRFYPSIFTFITLAGSMVLLAKAAVSIPIGIAYGVWVGIGAFGVAVVEILLFNQPPTILKIFFISLLVLSIIGLKVTGD